MLSVLNYNKDYDISRHIIKIVCELFLNNEYPMIAVFVNSKRLFIANNTGKRNPFLHAESILFYELYKIYGVYEIKEQINNGSIIIGSKPCVFCTGIMKYFNKLRYNNLTKPNNYISHNRYISFLKEFFKRKR